jgi:putative glutamine amidotransferase
MRARPIILLTPDVEEKGKEFGDLSSSLSGCYERALLEAGALPLTLPAVVSRKALAEYVRRSDGILLTGGDDINPQLYSKELPPRVRRTVDVTPDGGARDYRELVLLSEIFQQRKPLLAVCRGHQLLNIALGGTLVADIPSQWPGALEHRRLDRRDKPVHEVCLTSGSLLAKITGKAKLAVNSTHHQAIGKLAEPLRAVAVSPDGVVEGVELKPGAAGWLPFLLGIQFHPERLAGQFREHRAIFRAFARVCARGRTKQL